ncbi:hypothetical protein Tco_0016552 [Tanacetum coccineum]
MAISTVSSEISTAEEPVSTVDVTMPVSTVGMVQEANNPSLVATKDKGKAIMQESDDLDKLWSLVKERFSLTDPTDDKERTLWVELKRLFKPDTDDIMWKLQRYMHDPLIWRLYDTCGVRHVFTDRGHDIFMLVEKDYPLTRGLLTLMLRNKLQVDQYSEMADELLRKIVNHKFRGGLLGIKGFYKFLLLVQLSTSKRRLSTAKLRINNVLLASELTKPTMDDRMKRAHQQLSYLTTPTRRKSLKNAYIICDIYGRNHEVDEYDQNISHEQVCLSSGDIYDDPSLLKFYQNNDIPPWGNYIKEEGDEDLHWVLRSKFEDDMANFMMEKKHHFNGLREMLDQQKTNRSRKKDEDEKLLNIFKQILINLPFLEAMIHMPKGVKVLKDLLSHKEKLEKAASSVKLSEECSAVIQKGLP